MQHTKEYNTLIELVKRSTKASSPDIAFLLGLFSGDLAPDEYAELQALLEAK